MNIRILQFESKSKLRMLTVTVNFRSYNFMMGWEDDGKKIP